jgi:anti-anti-sigma factor
MFLDEFKSHIDVLRPCIVLDCSHVRQMDRPTLELLIYCLEEAMKRNGDVRLAAVSSQAKTILEGNGMADLFHFYDTDVQAVASFRRLSVAPPPTDSTAGVTP